MVTKRDLGQESSTRPPGQLRDAEERDSGMDFGCWYEDPLYRPFSDIPLGESAQLDYSYRKQSPSSPSGVYSDDFAHLVRFRLKRKVSSAPLPYCKTYEILQTLYSALKEVGLLYTEIQFAHPVRLNLSIHTAIAFTFETHQVLGGKIHLPKLHPPFLR